MWKFGISVSTTIEKCTLLNGPWEYPQTSGSLHKPMYTGDLQLDPSLDQEVITVPETSFEIMT